MTDNKHTPGKAVWDGGMSIDVGQWNILTLNTYAPEIENFEANAARIVTCWNEYDQLKAENEKVKRLLHDLTPGGSEFYNDPEYCAKWIREEREECAALQRGTIKELKAELEAAKQREEALLNYIKRFRIEIWETICHLNGLHYQNQLNRNGEKRLEDCRTLYYETEALNQ